MRLWMAVLFVSSSVASAAESGKTASELLQAGEKSYQSGQWELAAAAFSEFLTDYSGVEGAQVASAKVTPLLALCEVRLENYQEALPLLEKAVKQSSLEPRLRVELLFFAGLANLRCSHPEKARTHFAEVFTQPANERSRRMESLILGGMTYVMEKNWKETVDFFAKYTQEIRDYSPEAAARAELLWLHALMQEGRWDEASEKAKTLVSGRDQIRQVLTFSSMLIELGNHFMEVNQPYRAIELLRNVPAKLEIERQQAARLSEVEAELKTSAGNAVRAAQLQTMLAEIQREMSEFSKTAQFDSAVRLRLASAYFQLGRTREACLLIDQMARQMEPDETVEAATASLMRGWMSLGRYARAVRTANLYQTRCEQLAEKPNQADVLFLRAEALGEQFKYEEAADAFREVAEQFKGQPIAIRAEFMAAYQWLQQEKYSEAGAMLARQLKSLSAKDEMRSHVQFWRAMADYFDQKWELAREELGACLKDDPQGEYADDCYFRLAYSYFSEARYPVAIEKLKSFVANFPQSEWRAEALLALGDALAAEGDLDAAYAAYAGIGPEASGFHDEGWMKRGNLRKVLKDMTGMRQIYQYFLANRPDSPRIAEALQWLGWVAKQEGKPEEARAIYWDAIFKFGNDAARPGIEEIFVALQSFYPGKDREKWVEQLTQEAAKARAAGKKRLAIRIGWSLAQGDVSQRDILIALAPEMVPKETAPRILADVGDALAVDHPEQAETVYQGLRKWWPRAPERDRAFAGLGFILMKRGDSAATLARFDQYEKISVMPKTAADDHGVVLVEGELGGRVALAKVQLISSRQPELAMNTLLALQRAKSMPARIRGEAFLEAGRLQVRAHEERAALPYFEQVYLLFNRYPELVSAAYLERGAALETLRQPEKAREVYSELAQREDLKGLDSVEIAIERAEKLGGVLPQTKPDAALIPPASVTR